MIGSTAVCWAWLGGGERGVSRAAAREERVSRAASAGARASIAHEDRRCRMQPRSAAYRCRQLGRPHRFASSVRDPRARVRARVEMRQVAPATHPRMDGIGPCGPAALLLLAPDEVRAHLVKMAKARTCRSRQPSARQLRPLEVLPALRVSTPGAAGAAAGVNRLPGLVRGRRLHDGQVRSIRVLSSPSSSCFPDGTQAEVP